jgi:aminoglycoside N3'-acetyltransferase
MIMARSCCEPDSLPRLQAGTPKGGINATATQVKLATTSKQLLTLGKERSTSKHRLEESENKQAHVVCACTTFLNQSNIKILCRGNETAT